MGLPFTIRPRLVNDTGLTQFAFVRDGKTVSVLRYTVGSLDRRRETAAAVVANKALENGSPNVPAEVEAALEAAEVEVLETMTALDAEPASEAEQSIEESNRSFLAGMQAGKAQKAERGPSQADKLVSMVVGNADVELFHCEGDAYATVTIDGHRETTRVDSRAFKTYLSGRYFHEHDGAPNAEAIASARNVLTAQALHNGPEIPVYVRVAEHGGDWYLDLGDSTWTAVRVGADAGPDGWARVTSADCPVRFIRKPGMAALPLPVGGGSIDDLRPFLNVGDDAQWRMVVAWIEAALRPSPTYPILCLTGPQGSAKSTTCRYLRAVVDPSVVANARPPASERDLFIQARNSHIVTANNCSWIPPELSDAICCVADGDGFRIRAHYENDEEVIFKGPHPVMVNGIVDTLTRSDAADRAIFLTCPTIADDDYRPPEEIDAAFRAAHPRILGAFLGLTARAKALLPTIALDRTCRMAGFAKLAVAVERAAGWPDGSFLDAYLENRADRHAVAVEASAVATAVRDFVLTEGAWSGSATGLLARLTEVDDKGHGRWADAKLFKNAREWPQSAAWLSKALRRLVPNLSAQGIAVDPDARAADRRRSRLIRLGLVGDGSAAAPAPSQGTLFGSETGVPRPQEASANESQRAMVGAELANMRQGERTDLAHDCARLDQSSAAGAVNVSRRILQSAKAVLESGDADYTEAMAALADSTHRMEREAIMAVEAEAELDAPAGGEAGP